MLLLATSTCGLATASQVFGPLKTSSGRRLGTPPSKHVLVSSHEDQQQQASTTRRSLAEQYFDLVSNSMTENENEDEDEFNTGSASTKEATYPDLVAEPTEAKEECGEHSPEDDLYYCSDPALSYAIPCQDNCYWDLSQLKQDAPPGFCEFIQLDEAKLKSDGVVPDALKPCVIWEISFGTLFAPTKSPTSPPVETLGTFVLCFVVLFVNVALFSLTNPYPVSGSPSPSPAPSPAPTIAPKAATTDAPGAAVNTDDATPPPTIMEVVNDAPEKGVYAVVYNAVYLNLFLLAPSTKAKHAFEEADNKDELERITSSHILKHVRSVVDDPELVVACPTDATAVSTLAPWNNGTVVSSHSVEGAVHFHVDYGKPRPEAINNIVRDAFTGAALVQFVSELDQSSDLILQRTDSVYVGLPSEILPTVTTSTDSDSVSEEEEEEEDWMQWGDFGDLTFLVLVAVGGTAALVAFLYFVCRCFGHVGPRKDVGKKPLMVTHSKSAETSPLSPTSSSDGDKLTQDHLEFGGKVEDSAVAVIGEDDKNNGDDDKDDDVESSRFSEVTSIYSYLESKSLVDLDDQAYSVNDAYNPNISGDDASGDWSVNVGENTVVGAATATLGQSATPATVDQKEQESAKETAPSTPPRETLDGVEKSPAGPHIFSDNSEQSGGMASSMVEQEDSAADAVEDLAHPTRSRVASVVATFEAAQTKNSAKSSPAKSEASFPDRIESSILMLAPDSPKAAGASSAPASPERKKVPLPPIFSPADSVSEKQSSSPSQDTGVDEKVGGEVSSKSQALTSNKSHGSSSEPGSGSSDKQGSSSTSTVPTTISVQNSQKSDDSKQSNRSSASFVLRSKSVDQGEKTPAPPASIIRVAGLKDDKSPTASYIMRAKSWGSRTFPATNEPQARANDSGAGTTPMRKIEPLVSPKKSSFPFKGLGASKATQKALSPGEYQSELPAIRSNPSTLSEQQSILDTDSDIQSLCSFDNHSMFSFGGKNQMGGNASLLDMHGSSPYLQGTGLSDDDIDDDSV